MFSKRIIVLLTVIFVLLFTITFVSASQDNMTVDEVIGVDLSDGEEVIAGESNNGGIKSQDNNVEITSESGEFLDVNNAYVYLNEFRTTSGVWQWNEDDTTKTYFNTNDNNNLQSLARDLNLEETAKIRAKEIAEYFSHTRPDGTDCFTAFPDGLWAMGENIAYGQTSAKEVTVDWQEDNDPYSGQGHRRNMLSSDFNCVGIAAYKVKGIIYWVQDFGYSNNIVQGEIKYSVTTTNTNTKTTTNKQTTKLTAKSTTFKVKKSKKYIITLKAGKNPVKKVKITLKIKNKTYKATTDSKGKATFKIKITKKGTYKSTVKFAGNSSYKNVSKSVKIYVK